MAKLTKKICICALILGLQCGVGSTIWAAPSNDMQSWSVQEQEALAQKQQEIWRHEQAMLQRENESAADWQWRQWQEREQHIRNMQKFQEDGLRLDVTPVNW